MPTPAPSTRLPWIIIAGTFVVGLAGWAITSASKAPMVRPGDRLLVIGDSLGVGLNKSMAAGTPGAIAYDNISVGGTAIFQWARQSKLDQIRAKAPTVVLVSLGTNDGFMDDPASEAKSLQKLLFELRAMNMRVVWLLPPQVAAPRLDIVRAMVLEQVPARDVIDSEQWPVQLSGDGIHPTGAGYKDWSARIWRELTANR
jgi:lysophospholipase L1-like esterase